MSFNVGSGLLTAYVSPQRLHDIKQNSSLPEMSLWEKIKHFFFSTHQDAALNCLHKLYHHDELSMSEQDIRETFTKLQSLASPGCRNKFTVDRNNYTDIYKINFEIILVIPKTNSDSISKQNNSVWHDCHDERDIWYDSQDDDEVWLDCQELEVDSDISSWQQIDNYAPEEISSPVMRKALSDDDIYIQSIKMLMPRIEESFQRTGVGHITSTIGTLKALLARSIGKRIVKNINQQITNKHVFKKDIDKLLKIPGMMQLIPPEITSMPEFSIILGGPMIKG